MNELDPQKMARVRRQTAADVVAFDDWLTVTEWSKVARVHPREVRRWKRLEGLPNNRQADMILALRSEPGRPIP